MTTSSQGIVQLSRRGTIVLSLGFVLMCLVPLLVTAIRPWAVGRERADETSFPKVANARELLSWPGRFKYYFGEHFGLRDQLIYLHGKCKVDGMGVTSSSKVLLGRDDWLFLAEEGVLDYTRGRDLFDSTSLSTWRQTLEARRTWLAEQGIRYLVVIAPNKHTIYPEYLPPHLAPVARRSRLDQLVTEVAGRVDLLDLRPTIVAAKSKGRVFHKTDTHWNLLAGKVATAAVVRHLAGSQQLADLQLGTGLEQRVQPGGDLARILGLKNVHKEIDLIPQDYLQARSEDGQPLADNHLDVRGDADITTVQTGAEGRVVVFSDSFGQAMLPWMAKHFARVRWLRSYGFDREVVLREKPTIVIQQLVERKLFTTAPDGTAIDAKK